MHSYYELDIIPIILNRFKVTKLIIIGVLDEHTFNQILNYCDINNSQYVDFKNDFALDRLNDINDYGAIFLNNDPNWYTVYNELNFIKKYSNSFPLVFICNNIFPNKRRDAYSAPINIPKEYINDYSDYFIYNNIQIKDGFFHAIEENTAKNGVLTAIEDFLIENSSIGIFDIKFSNGISILYSKNSISQIRLSMLSDEIKGHELVYEELVDSSFKNKFLEDFISNSNITSNDVNFIENIKLELNEKEIIIKDYEDMIRLHDDEVAYKDSQINSFNSKLSLKDAQLKNFESKLVNRENEINGLKNEINNLNDEFNSIKQSLSQKEQLESNLTDKLIEANTRINAKNDEINFKNIQITVRENELNNNKVILDSIKKEYVKKLSQLDNNEYCISCYKDKIHNSHLEIQYLNNNVLIKKLFEPIAYLYLILKSNSKEISLNLKLYKALKNSKCFDIGYYLNNNMDIQDSKWCKYFSPELHYVCFGFGEKRKFNKKFFNRNSKKELLEYISNCNDLD